MPKNKKVLLIGGGGLVLIFLFLYIRSRQAAAAGSGTTDTTGTTADQAAADYASLAGQQQQASAQEQSDFRTLTDAQTAFSATVDAALKKLRKGQKLSQSEIAALQGQVDTTNQSLLSFAQGQTFVNQVLQGEVAAGVASPPPSQPAPAPQPAAPGGWNVGPLSNYKTAASYASAVARASQYYGETSAAWNSAYNNAFNAYYRYQHKA